MRAPIPVISVLLIASIACRAAPPVPPPETRPPAPALAPEPSGFLVHATLVIEPPSGGEAVRFPAIELIDAATGAVRTLQIGREPEDELGNVELSPDGRRFVMVVQLDRNGPYKSWGREIWVADRDGRQPVRLLRIDEDLETIRATWSPDSALVLIKTGGGAFILDPSERRYWVWSACGVSDDDHLIGWSDDGGGALFAKVSFTGQPATILECRLPATRVTVGKAPNAEAVSLSRDRTLVSGIQDGRTVVVSPFVAWAPRPVFTTGPGDTARTALWSPDGRWLAIKVGPRDDLAAKVVLANIATRQTRSLGKIEPGALGWWAERAASGVDSRRIVSAALGKGKKTMAEPADAERRYEDDE